MSHKAVLIVPYTEMRSHMKSPLGKNLLTQEHGCWYRSLLAVVGLRAVCFFKASKWEERESSKVGATHHMHAIV